MSWLHRYLWILYPNKPTSHTIFAGGAKPAIPPSPALSITQPRPCQCPSNSNLNLTCLISHCGAQLVHWPSVRLDSLSSIEMVLPAIAACGHPSGATSTLKFWFWVATLPTSELYTAACMLAFMQTFAHEHHKKATGRHYKVFWWPDLELKLFKLFTQKTRTWRTAWTLMQCNGQSSIVCVSLAGVFACNFARCHFYARLQFPITKNDSRNSLEAM